MNRVRAPLSTRSRIISHAGYLFYKAAEICHAAGFTDVRLRQVPMTLSFPENLSRKKTWRTDVLSFTFSYWR